MGRPLISVVIATQGRSTLPRALASIAGSGADVETIVVADTHAPLLANVAEIAHLFGARYLEHDAGFHDSGHPQAQIGQEAATGRWLAYLGDDDVYLPGALDTIARDTETFDGYPLLYRARMHPSPTRACVRPITLWLLPRLQRGAVTGQNIVCPNDPTKLGRWGDDYSFMEDTVALYDGEAVWRDEVIVECF